MSDKSKYFPERKRMASARECAEAFGCSEAGLGNLRSNGGGFPFLRMNAKIIYDLDACYEHAMQAGFQPSGNDEAA